MAIKRGCSDRWRGGTGTLACAQGGCLPCIGHRQECLCHTHAAPDRPRTRVPKRSFPDVVPPRRAKYAQLDSPGIARLSLPCACLLLVARTRNAAL
jgi:hypothetical protein